MPAQRPVPLNPHGKTRFAAKLKAKHGDHIIAVSEYRGSKQPITIRCSAGHEYETKPEYILQTGCRQCGYATCGSSNRLTTKDYKRLVREKYGDTLIVKGECTGSYQPLTHRCKPCGKTFDATPQAMLYKQRFYGCVECSTQFKGRARLTAEVVNQRLQERHGGNVILLDAYRGSLTPHQFQCVPAGHTWQTTPDSVMRLSGCPKCNTPLKSSKIGIEWIERMARKMRLKFEHAGNGGERHLYGASGKRYYVDGFNARKNIILEFDGDAWHGNPAIYKPRSKPHPFERDLTAAALLKKTENKVKDLAAAGYIVIRVWQNDYANGLLVSSTHEPAS